MPRKGDRRPIAIRLRARREFGAGGCWLWTGPIRPDGYAHINVNERGMQLVHRLAYEEWRGAIPEGLTLDHLCRTKHCFNPWHLEAVTHAENVRRGPMANRTHCKNGHPWDEENTRLATGPSGNLIRRCRSCERENSRRRYSRRKAEV